MLVRQHSGRRTPYQALKAMLDRTRKHIDPRRQTTFSKVKAKQTKRAEVTVQVKTFIQHLDHELNDL